MQYAASGIISRALNSPSVCNDGATRCHSAWAYPSKNSGGSGTLGNRSGSNCARIDFLLGLPRNTFNGMGIGAGPRIKTPILRKLSLVSRRLQTKDKIPKLLSLAGARVKQAMRSSADMHKNFWNHPPGQCLRLFD